MDRSWTWFISTGHDRWIIIEGVCHITFEKDKFIACLYFAENDKTPYVTIEGTIDNKGNVYASCQSADPDVPTYEVIGLYNEAEFPDGTACTFSLIDGGTLIGIKTKK